MSHLLKKTLLMLVFVATFAGAQASNAVGQSSNFSAVVDIGTGEIILELGSGFPLIVIQSVAGTALFDITAFDATTGLGAPQQLDPFGIGFLSLGPFPAGVFNFGAILDEPFRSLEGLESLAVIGNETGDLLTVANGGITVINTIPEPGSLSLLALASLSVVARRRR